MSLKQHFSANSQYADLGIRVSYCIAQVESYLIPDISVPSAQYVDYRCFANTIPVQLHRKERGGQSNNNNKEGSMWYVWHRKQEQLRWKLAAFQSDGSRLDVSELLKGGF